MRAATRGQLKSSASQIVDMQSQGIQKILLPLMFQPKCIAISNDGKVVLFGNQYDEHDLNSSGMFFWVPGAASGVPKLQGHFEINDVEFLGDSHIAVTCSNDMTVRTWDLELLVKQKIKLNLADHDPFKK